MSTEESKQKTDKTVRFDVEYSENEENKPKPQPKQKEVTGFSDGASTSGFLMSLMMRDMGLEITPDPVFEEFTLEGAIKFIQSGKCSNIVTITGAGISTAAGIPDFRSKGTGLYDNLEELMKTYNVSNPTDLYQIDFFKENPEPFFIRAKEMWPGRFKPTLCHYFIKLLDEKGLLLRHFTQNIDGLERIAAIGKDKIVEAHGGYHTAHCLDCNFEYTGNWVKDRLFDDKVPVCTENDCGGLVKPDIVMFGEQLPQYFFDRASEDLPKCDLLLIMGTSLVVQPFASLISRVPQSTPRVYINLEMCQGGDTNFFMLLMGFKPDFRFGADDNYRDVFWEGKCDEGCCLLAEGLGWQKELDELVRNEHKRLDKEIAAAGYPLPLKEKAVAAKKEATSPKKAESPKDGSEKKKASGSSGVKTQSTTTSSVKTQSTSSIKTQSTSSVKTQQARRSSVPLPKGTGKTGVAKPDKTTTSPTVTTKKPNPTSQTRRKSLNK